MTDTVKYPKTMAALARVEGTVWGVADALWEEVAVTQDGRPRQGQFEAISQEAAGQGLVNPTTGAAYASDYFGQLYRVARFVKRDALEIAVELRTYPVRRVAVAAEKAKRDPVRTLEILRTGQTLHEISGSSPLGRAGLSTAEQAKAAVKASSTAARKAMVEEAIQDPEVARAIAEEGTVQETLIEAKLDVAHRKATGKSVRPTGTKDVPAEEEEEGPLRPGLQYLAIGTPLYRVRVNLIEAMGHARESDVHPSTRTLLMEDIVVIRELLVDLQLVLEGEKEISDKDLATWLKQAEDDMRERR